MWHLGARFSGEHGSVGYLLDSVILQNFSKLNDFMVLDSSELRTGISSCELNFKKDFQMRNAHRNNWELGT